MLKATVHLQLLRAFIIPAYNKKKKLLSSVAEDRNIISLFFKKDNWLFCIYFCCLPQYDTDFYVLDKYPLAVRPFYTMPDPNDLVSLSR